jgi:hypothetical protein
MITLKSIKTQTGSCTYLGDRIVEIIAQLHRLLNFVLPKRFILSCDLVKTFELL